MNQSQPEAVNMNQPSASRANQLHDGFRRALDVLIAQAPGTQAEILHALSDASRSFAQQGRLQHITKSESSVAGHLMILGVGQILTQAPKVEPLHSGFVGNVPRNAYGLTHRAPSFDTAPVSIAFRARPQAGQPNKPSVLQHDSRKVDQASGCPEALTPSSPALAGLASPPELPSKAKPSPSQPSVLLEQSDEFVGRSSSEPSSQ